MKKLFIVISAATCVAVFTHIAPLIGAPAGFLVVLFVCSQFIVIYMAYVIEHGIPSVDTFEDKFYEDPIYRSSRPNGGPDTGWENP